MSEAALQGQGPRAKGQGFRALVAWQKAHELPLAVFRATQPLARTQGWLVRQCTSSVISVPANIAEGYSRASRRDYLRYLNIARGSLAETEYYILFLRDSGLLQGSELERLEALRTDAGNLLIGLIRALEDKERTQPKIRDGHGEYETALADDLGPWPLALDPQTPPAAS